EAGFAGHSPDGVSVPEPVGLVSRLQLWLQRKVPGQVATGLLAGPGGPALARRVAEAAHKLHPAGVPAPRRHTPAGALRILRDCLAAVAQDRPAWAGRLARLLEACARRAAATPDAGPCGTHRDFYADQVIVDGPRLYLLDFDLYCAGDPG